MGGGGGQVLHARGAGHRWEWPEVRGGGSRCPLPRELTRPCGSRVGELLGVDLDTVFSSHQREMVARTVRGARYDCACVELSYELIAAQPLDPKY